jgi:hypothetical protein
MGALLYAVLAASNIACFIIGAKVGQTVIKGEEVRLPEINPLQAYREKQERHEADMERSKVDTILRNIERYDGTSAGQEDVPGSW